MRYTLAQLRKMQFPHKEECEYDFNEELDELRYLRDHGKQWLVDFEQKENRHCWRSLRCLMPTSIFLLAPKSLSPFPLLFLSTRK